MPTTLYFLIRSVIFLSFSIWALLSEYRKMKKLRNAISNRVVQELEKFREELARVYRRWKLYLCIYCFSALILVSTALEVHLGYYMEQPLLVASIVALMCVAIVAVILFIRAVRLVKERHSFEQLDLYLRNTVGKQVVMESFYKPYVFQETCYLLLFLVAMALIIMSPYRALGRS